MHAVRLAMRAFRLSSPERRKEREDPTQLLPTYNAARAIGHKSPQTLKLFPRSTSARHTSIRGAHQDRSWDGLHSSSRPATRDTFPPRASYLHTVVSVPRHQTLPWLQY